VKPCGGLNSGSEAAQRKLGSSAHYLLAHVALARGDYAEARSEARRLAEAARTLGANARAGVAPENAQACRLAGPRVRRYQFGTSFLALLDRQRMPQEKVYTEFAYFNLRGDIEMAMRNSAQRLKANARHCLCFPRWSLTPL